MRDYLARDIRNVVLLGHAAAGKTALVEACLYKTKQIERMGNGRDVNFVLDYDQEGVKRKQSVFTALMPIEWKNSKINFIDTPGYLDYEGKMQAGLAVGDNALIVVSAKDGIESGTEKAVKYARQKGLPTIFFVNKLDEDHSDYAKVYQDLRDKFGKNVFLFEMPIIENREIVGSINILRGKAWYYNNLAEPQEVPESYKDEVALHYNEIAEAIATTDDELMEKFFMEEPFTEAEIAKGLRIAVRSGEICPVYCGSAAKNIGISRLLDLVTEYFPCYAEKGTVTAKDPEGNEVLLETNGEETFSAQVFKTVVDPFVGKITYFKIMSGVLTSDSVVYNSKKEETEKISQIYVVKGRNQEAVGKLFTGDLGCVTKLSVTETNDTLCDEDKPVIFPDIQFPEPMLGVAIMPKTKADEDKMSFALQKILDEDKSLRLEKNAETNEQILYAVGDQHIDVVLSKLKNKYKVEVQTAEPTVQYRETIRGKAEVQGKHKKQSGGAGQYGDVWIRFEPCDSDEMVFAEEVFGGAVPRQYFPAVEDGLRECMKSGVLAGYKVVGVKATLYDGSYHPVDSKEIAFKAAARLAYKAGMPKAKPILLEPIVKATVTAPEEYTGAIIGDFSKRRGIIMGSEVTADHEIVVDVEVPMAEMMRYATELRSMTQGRGSYHVEFARYEPAPQNIAESVIASRKAQLEEKE
ncbi:MAG: elongation factor G [Erysipelotrichaceae bacterium]|nr:elongation factor G [Erysipelotrichaceae bacterium]